MLCDLADPLPLSGGALSTRRASKSKLISVSTASSLLGLLLLVLPATLNAQFTYTTNNGAIIITGYTGSGGAVTIPESTNGWPVTCVGPFAFLNKVTVRSVAIPDSILSISNSAFSGCGTLTNVSFGANLAYVGPAAFQYCSQLGEVIIPDTVTNIGSSAFAYCANLTNLVLGSKVAGLGSSAFQSCSRLTKVIFPASVTSLGSSAFASCGNLTGAFFTTNAPSANTTVFTGDNRAIAYYLAGTTGWGSTFGGIPTMPWYPAIQCGYIVNGGTIQIARYTGSGGAVDIPAAINGTNVTSIGPAAFKDEVSLASVTLPATLTRIWPAAFSGSGLTNVLIPASVTNIGTSAFANCASLSAITVDPANAACVSLDGVLFDKALTTLLQCPGGKTGSCPVPATVTNIATGALSPCLLVASIDVDPLNVVYSSLDGVLLDQSQGTLLRYPQGRAGSYTVPASVTNIADSAFASSAALTGVVVGDNVLTLGTQAFEGSGSLTNAIIGDGVTMLSPFAFNACGNLVSVTLGTNVTRLGQAAFQLCGKLTHVKLPPTLTVVDSWVFNQCGALPGIDIENVVSIGDYAFNLCLALKSIYLPSLTSLGVDVFGGCTGLATITFGAGLAYLPDWTFNSCHSLTSVYFCGNRPNYGSYVFAYANTPVVYYLPGTANWGAVFDGVPTALWQPFLETGGPGLGAQTNRFDFSIWWAPGQTVVVEACTDCYSPFWTPLTTNMLTSNSILFSDSEYTNYPARFYRVRSE